MKQPSVPTFEHCDHVEDCRKDPSNTDCGADPCNLVGEPYPEQPEAVSDGRDKTFRFHPTQATDYRLEAILAWATAALAMLDYGDAPTSLREREARDSVARIIHLAGGR